MRRYSLTAILVILASTCGAQTVTTGAPAPPIVLDQLLPAQPAANATLSALSGKAIALEFWATWCAPCIDQIPHINELAERFKGRPVQFISITDEEPSLIEGFLKRRPISGWVGIDRKNQTRSPYGFEGIPKIVLIDRAGKVAAVSHPALIQASHVEDLLAGRPISVPQPRKEPPIVPVRDKGPAPILDVLIRSATGEESSASSSSSSSGAKYSARGRTVRELLATAYGFLPSRIEGEPVASADRYDVTVSVAGTKSDSLNISLQHVLCAAFHLKVSRLTRETDVLVLKAPNGKPAGLVETVSTGGSMSSSGNGQVRLIGSPVGALANAVAHVLGKNVVDETGLSGKYDIVLKYDDNAPGTLVDALRTTLGLKVEPARRPLEFLVATRDTGGAR